MSDADAFVGRGQLVGDAAGPVRRTVVDHEQHGAGDRCEDRLGDRPDVVGLVVGRQDDPRPGPRGVLVGHGRQCSGALGGQWAWTTTVRAYHVVPTQLRAQTTTLYVPRRNVRASRRPPIPVPGMDPAPNEPIGPDRPNERGATVDPDRHDRRATQVDADLAALAGARVERTVRPAHRADRPIDEDRVVRDGRVAGTIAGFDLVRVAAVLDGEPVASTAIPGAAPGQAGRERPGALDAPVLVPDPNGTGHRLARRPRQRQRIGLAVAVGAQEAARCLRHASWTRGCRRRP